MILPKKFNLKLGQEALGDEEEKSPKFEQPVFIESKPKPTMIVPENPPEEVSIIEPQLSEQSLISIDIEKH